jgi:hypothetical protein
MSGKPSGRATLNDRMEAYFKAHPNEWVSFHQLAHIGGTGGWRTRVSQCRRERGMTIENKWREEGGFRVSYYRYRPAGTQTEAAA